MSCNMTYLSLKPEMEAKFCDLNGDSRLVQQRGTTPTNSKRKPKEIKRSKNALTIR